MPDLFVYVVNVLFSFVLINFYCILNIYDGFVIGICVVDPVR